MSRIAFTTFHAWNAHSSSFLLQKAVIMQLRERGYSALADMAKESWSNGERLPLVEPPAGAPENLITDLAKANEHAGREH